MATFKVIELCEVKRVYTVDALTLEEAQERVEEGYVDYDEEDYVSFEVVDVFTQ